MFGIEEKSQEAMLRKRLDQLEDLFEDIKQEFFMMAKDYDSATARIEELEADALDREEAIKALEIELECRRPFSCTIHQNIREVG